MTQLLLSKTEQHSFILQASICNSVGSLQFVNVSYHDNEWGNSRSIVESVHAAPYSCLSMHVHIATRSAQITWKKSNMWDYMQHMVRRVSLALSSDRVKIAFILFMNVTIYQSRKEGNWSTGRKTPGKPWMIDRHQKMLNTEVRRFKPGLRFKLPLQNWGQTSR